MLFDVHAHLNFDQFKKDLGEVIQRSEEAGVIAIINNGTDVKGNRETLELASKYKIIKPALGIYPSDAIAMSDEDFNKEIDFISKQKIVAIGEVGLDFLKVSDHEKQEKAFIKFIHLAKRMDIPLIVHSRGAEERVFELLQFEGAKKVIMHCFSGKAPLIEKIEKAGYSFSVPPAIMKSKTFQKLVKKVSITKLLTETDSPFLSHVQGERNEPKNVEVTIKKISEIKKMDFLEVKKNLFMNFQRFFKIETF